MLVEARTARADELVDVGVVARGAQELPAIDHVHVRALANPDGSAVGPRIDAQRPQRAEKAQDRTVRLQVADGCFAEKNSDVARAG